MKRTRSRIRSPFFPKFQQSVEKRTITSQGHAQVLSGHFVTAVQLLFQSRPLVGETLCESLHRRSHQGVCVFDSPAWFVHKTSLYLAPLRSEISHLRFRKQGQGP